MNSMSDPGSITALISKLQRGESVAASGLWERYYERLVVLARRMLRSSPRRVADEEDIVVMAFEAFLRGVEARRFPRLDDRSDLWQILVMITARKAANQFRYDRRQKRGEGQMRGESAFMTADEEQRGIDQVAGAEPSPEFVVQLTDEYRHLLELLGDDTLRNVAIAKMHGYSNVEIAQQFQVQTRTIQRKLRIIRELWTNAKDF
jgi:RNA polymerase sigma factor (sigma-70 family)